MSVVEYLKDRGATEVVESSAELEDVHFKLPTAVA